MAEPLSFTSFCLSESFSPAATFSISSTRSSPVTSSVTGMLHLEPRVHLEEIEIAVLVDDELDRAGGVVADRLGQRDGLRAHRLARLGVEERARRLLDDLLIAPLDRAFALIEMDDITVLVAEHLDLDMPRLLDIFLDEHAVVAEARLGLGLRRGEAFLHLLAAIGDAHALAAAAGARLDHHRIADLVGDLDRLLGVLDHAEMARHGRDLGLGRELLRLRSCRPSPRWL